MSKRKHGSDYGDASTDSGAEDLVPSDAVPGTEDTSLSGPAPDAPGGESEAPAQTSTRAAEEPAPEPKPLATGAAIGAPEGDIEAARQRLGGQEPPRAAPKAGEGVNALAREVAHPELEPPTPPVEYRVAPSAPGELEREPFGARPSYDELKQAYTVRVRTVDERSAGLYCAGILVTPQPAEVLVASVIDRGETHLRQLASDPRIEVELV